MNNSGKELTLSQSLTRITIAGCLSMIFSAGVTAPPFAEFLREIGAREMAFGLIGGIPPAMIWMEFVGAAIMNHIKRRKPLFMTCVIISRLLYLAIAFLPLMLPPQHRAASVVAIMALFGLSAALSYMTEPLWFSWMADLIPRRVLNRFWGRRQMWLYMTWTAAYLGVAAYSFLMKMPAVRAFPILVCAAVAGGVVDILLFKKIEEPPNTISRGAPIVQALVEPLLHPEYRSVVSFYCAYLGVCMFSSAFMMLWGLKGLRMTVWETTLAWCLQGVGIALSSGPWGKIADRHGHRPVIILCSAFKPLVAVAFLLATPGSAMLVLSVALLLDGIFGSGIMIAVNGYMLKMAPRKNRSMFIAAVLGFGGICGGIGSVMGGGFLKAFSDFSVEAFGREWNNYHLLFFVNAFMRVILFVAARRIREIRSMSSARLLNRILSMLPELVLSFPVGLYRRIGSARQK